MCGGNHEAAPALPGQDPAERGQKETVSWPQIWPSDLAAQDLQLVTQDDDLEVDGVLIAVGEQPKEFGAASTGWIGTWAAMLSGAVIEQQNRVLAPRGVISGIDLRSARRIVPIGRYLGV